MTCPPRVNGWSNRPRPTHKGKREPVLIFFLPGTHFERYRLVMRSTPGYIGGNKLQGLGGRVSMPSSSRREASLLGGRPSGSGLRNYRRTGLALLLFAATALALIITAPGAAPGADTAAFYPGTATATAQPMAIKPSTAGLGYTMTLANTSAEYEQGLAKALSQTLNLGSIGTSLTTANCGKPPTVQGSSLPQPASVESDQGPPSQSLTSAGTFNGSGAGAGVEQASVTNQPLATAIAKGGDMNVAGAFDMSGLQRSEERRVGTEW